jgi:hypothetical protein
MASWSNYHTNNENEEKERQRNHFSVVFSKLGLGKKYFSIEFKKEKMQQPFMVQNLRSSGVSQYKIVFWARQAKYLV